MSTDPLDRARRGRISLGIDAESFAIALARGAGNQGLRRVYRSLRIIQTFYGISPPTPERPVWTEPFAR